MLWLKLLLSGILAVSTIVAAHAFFSSYRPGFTRRHSRVGFVAAVTMLTSLVALDICRGDFIAAVFAVVGSVFGFFLPRILKTIFPH